MEPPQDCLRPGDGWREKTQTVTVEAVYCPTAEGLRHNLVYEVTVTPLDRKLPPRRAVRFNIDPEYVAARPERTYGTVSNVSAAV